MDSLGKLIFCSLFLAYVANSVHCKDSNKTEGLPVFTWGKGNNKLDPISMTISFPDKGPDDSVALQKTNPIKQNKKDKGDKEDVDPCILTGYLRDEDDVYVSVNGCPQSKNFEIAFDSKRLKASMFRVVKGKTQSVNHLEERSLNAARIDVLDNPHFDTEGFKRVVAREDSGASWTGSHHNHCGNCHHGCRCHCRHHHFTAGITFLYSYEWYKGFGGGSVNALRRVYNLVQNIFYWRSSPLRLTLRVVRYGYTGKKFTATAAHLNYLSGAYWPHANYYGNNMLALMTYEGHKTGIVGIGYKPSICGYYRYKGMITEFFRSYAITAEILAHEIGHAFGIGHDYGPKNALRRDSAGHKCSGVGGIMGHFARWPRCWSSCSCQDWCHYYNWVLHTRDRFCLDCRDKFPFCAYVATMYTFFCRSAVVRRSCPRACRLCGNVLNYKNWGTGIISNMKIGGRNDEQSGPVVMPDAKLVDMTDSTDEEEK